jgi:hypothetical protein
MGVEDDGDAIQQQPHLSRMQGERISFRSAASRCYANNSTDLYALTC